MTAFLLTAVLSYLLGSIPFGYILVRAFRGEDVRQTAAATLELPMSRALSRLLGVVTLLSGCVERWRCGLTGSIYFPDQRILAGVAALCAVAGHVFPVWLGFRGGKGVATSLGSFVMLAPKAVLLVIGVFVAVVLLFRYVSLGSIISVALFPIFALVAARLWRRPSHAWFHGGSGDSDCGQAS